MLVETALLFILVLSLFYLSIRKQWNVLRELNIPHEAPSLQNVGHALLMFGKNSVEFELQCKRKFGDIWGCYIGTQPRIVMHDPEMIRSVMVKNFLSFPNRFRRPGDFGSKDVEKGILVADWVLWKRMRPTLNPTFSSTKLKSMSPIVANCIKNTSERLKAMGRNRKLSTVDVKDLFNRLSLDVICSVAFSVDVNSQDDGLPEPEISKKAKAFFLLSLVERIKIFVKISFPFLRTFIGDGSRRIHASYFKGVVQKLIDNRDVSSSLLDTTRSRPTNLMEAMINLRKTAEELEIEKQNGLSDSEIMSNAITMLLAGYETTAVAMMYFAYNLAFNDTVQIMLQKEIDEAFGANEVDFDTATRLKYLDMCVNESLRLYCPVGRTARVASRDMIVSGVKVPKGVMVSIPIAALCRDPDIWEDPMKYNPERMRDMQSFDPMLFQPFGIGPRNCIGMKFAMMEIKLAFCNLLREYTFKPVAGTPRPPLVLKQMTTTSPVEDIELELIPRN